VAGFADPDLEIPLDIRVATYAATGDGDTLEPHLRELVDRFPEIVGSVLVVLAVLTDCLRVYIQVKELGVEDIGELPFSAQVVLLPAPPEAKRPLAKRALAEGMSVRELREAVKEVRPPEDRRGRPPKRVVDKALGRVCRGLDLVGEGWDVEVVERGGDRLELLRQAREARERLDGIVRRLEELWDE
jgi:hypothetical protein